MGEPIKVDHKDLTITTYKTEEELDIMMKMCQEQLSEPYSIYTYRYFVDNWPNLTFLVRSSIASRDLNPAVRPTMRVSVSLRSLGT